MVIDGNKLQLIVNSELITNSKLPITNYS